MKIFKSIALVALITASAVPAFAQFSNASTSSSKGNGTGLIKDCSPYDRVTLSYLNRSFSSKKAYELIDDGFSTNGVSLDYLHGFSLSSNLPIFLETGIGVDFGMWSETEEDEDYKDLSVKSTITTMSFAVPLNVAYKFKLNDNFSLVPFVGLNLKLNAIGNYKNKFEYDGTNDYMQEIVDEENDDLKTMSFFDKDDFYKDYRWKRFQMGWHIGVGANINKLYIGLSYGSDFMELWKKTTTSAFKIGVGYNF